MRPLNGRHAVGGFKITTLGRGGFASRLLRPSFAMSAGRHSRRASVAGLPIQRASPPCSPWHRDPHLGGSGRRMAVPRLTSRTVTAGPGSGARDPPIWRAASGTCSGLSGRQIRALGAAVSSGRPFVLAGTRHAGGGQVRGLSGLVDAVGSAKHRRPSTHTRTRALFIDGIGIVDQDGVCVCLFRVRKASGKLVT